MSHWRMKRAQWKKTKNTFSEVIDHSRKTEVHSTSNNVFQEELMHIKNSSTIQVIQGIQE